MTWTKKKNDDFRYRYTFKKCSVKDCDRNAKVKGLCILHYNKRKKHASNKSKSN